MRTRELKRHIAKENKRAERLILHAQTEFLRKIQEAKYIYEQLTNTVVEAKRESEIREVK